MKFIIERPYEFYYLKFVLLFFVGIALGILSGCEAMSPVVQVEKQVIVCGEANAEVLKREISE